MDHNIKNRRGFSAVQLLEHPGLRLIRWEADCAPIAARRTTTASPWPPGTPTRSPDSHLWLQRSASAVLATNRSPKNSGFDLTTIGWPATYNQSVPAVMRTPPTPCVANFADNIICTQGQSFIQDRNTQYNLSPSISMLRGRHQYQIGFQFEVGRDNYAQSNIAKRRI